MLEKVTNSSSLLLKLFKLLVIYLLSCVPVLGQQLDGNRRIVYLVNNEVRYLNGGVRACAMGGKSRLTIQVDLPPNTIEWMYTCRASKNQNSLQPIALASQVLKYLGPAGTLAALAAEGIPASASPGIVDVYLIDSYQEAQNFIAKGRFRCFAQYSKENLQSGAVAINDLTRGFCFIGLKNPSGLEGVSVSLDVIAIVQD